MTPSTPMASLLTTKSTNSLKSSSPRRILSAGSSITETISTSHKGVEISLSTRSTSTPLLRSNNCTCSTSNRSKLKMLTMIRMVKCIGSRVILWPNNISMTSNGWWMLRLKNNFKRLRQSCKRSKKSMTFKLRSKSLEINGMKKMVLRLSLISARLWKSTTSTWHNQKTSGRSGESLRNWQKISHMIESFKGWSKKSSKLINLLCTQRNMICMIKAKNSRWRLSLPIKETEVFNQLQILKRTKTNGTISDLWMTLSWKALKECKVMKQRVSSNLKKNFNLSLWIIINWWKTELVRKNQKRWDLYWHTTTNSFLVVNIKKSLRKDSHMLLMVKIQSLWLSKNRSLKASKDISSS